MSHSVTHGFIRVNHAVVGYNIFNNGQLAGVAHHTADGGFTFASQVYGLPNIAYVKTMESLKALIEHHLGGHVLVPAGQAAIDAANAVGAAVANTPAGSGPGWDVNIHVTNNGHVTTNG
jgi:hypothetical protein